jgi:uncharacterized NAD(P)/FAD-binding protein YdhS
MTTPAKAPFKKIAIIGGGPAALFLFKEFIGKSNKDYTIDIFEAGRQLGVGMPYSKAGANPEHITNISSNEVPELVIPLTDWIEHVPAAILEEYGVEKKRFHEHKLLPRLLFGQYLNDQFREVLDIAANKGIDTRLHLSTSVKDIIDYPDTNKVSVETEGKDIYQFDTVIICTGHSWPCREEGKIKGYFDSPFPPQKIKNQYNHAVALRGSSLTAIDAIVTLAIQHGRFVKDTSGKLTWRANEDTPNFKIVMHSLLGLLPAIRFHLQDPQLKNDIQLNPEEIFQHIVDNDGFLSLDYLFEKNFKDPMKTRDPEFYKQISGMNLEEFGKNMMDIRKQADAFQLFKAEYQEAASSIRRHKPIYWKELLSALNYAINYPAKHLSAEDTLRLHTALMPLIGIIIAFVPQESCEQMIALHEAGRLEIVSVDEESSVEGCKEGGIIYHYKDIEGTEQHQRYFTYIDCSGQQPLSLEEFPLKSLVKEDIFTRAFIKFRSPEAAKKEKEKNNKDVVQQGDSWFLRVPGIAVTDSFCPIDKDGHINRRIYLLASPFISGYNPDFSGLDFCATVAKIVTEDIFS